MTKKDYEPDSKIPVTGTGNGGSFVVLNVAFDKKNGLVAAGRTRKGAGFGGFGRGVLAFRWCVEMLMRRFGLLVRFFVSERAE